MFDELVSYYPVALLLNCVLYAIGFYAVFCLSIVLWYRFKVPRVISAHGTDVSKAFTIAHRGGRDTVPENTLSAFKYGAKHCDMLELDVWLTKDGKVCVFHDGDLQRVTGVKGHVTKTNFKNLPRVWRKQSDGWQQGEGHSKGTESIPLLSEVLDTCPNSMFLVEFKQSSPILIDKVHKLLKQQDLLARKRVVWFSLHESINRMLITHDPTIPLLASANDVMKSTLLYHTGVLRFVNTPFSIYGTKVGKPESMLGLSKKIPILTKLPPDMVLRLIEMLMDWMHDPNLISHFRDRGMPVYILGVNSENEYEQAMRIGATAVLTDRPEWLRKVTQH